MNSSWVDQAEKLMNLKRMSYFAWQNMSESWIVAAIAMAVFAYCCMHIGTKKVPKLKLPPGPRSWPIVGNLGLLLQNLPHHAFMDVAKQYGPIFFFKMGDNPAIVITSPELNEEVLVDNYRIFSDRYPVAAADIVGRNRTMTFLNGERWRFIRTICVKELFTKTRINNFQSIRTEEGLAMLKHIKQEMDAGKLVVIRDMVFPYIINSFTRIMFSKSYFGSSKGMVKEELEVQNLILQAMKLFGCFNLGDFIPLLKPFDVQGMEKKMRQLSVEIDVVMGAIIKDKEVESEIKSLSPNFQASGKNERTKDFLDTLLNFTNRDGAMKVDEDTVKIVPMELLMAANDSSVATIEWCFTELMLNPETRRTLQKELGDVVGFNRILEESDIPNLPYLDAVVKETLRLHPPSPLLLPRVSTAPCKIGGYDIPKGTNTFINVYAIGRLESCWDRASEFDPSRFMGGVGETIAKNIEMVAFGIGSRMCPGRDLGLLTVKLTVARILHACDLDLPHGLKPEELDMGEEYGIAVVKVKPLEVLATLRLSNLDDLIRTSKPKPSDPK